jgi:geranylgeranyl pyrophosphate synthase
VSVSEFDPLLASLSESAGWIGSALGSAALFQGGVSRLPSLASHLLMAGGKRIRPFLVRAACLAGGGDPSRCLHAAVAVEMLHTYSLIHDDLPCMDDDDLRRGLPTLHRLPESGVAQAVLAGDRLLVEAFSEILLSPFPPAFVASMLLRLARAAGACFLVGGQHMDMHPPEVPSRPWIEEMIRGKTAALIRTSLELGAVCGGFAGEVLDEVSRLGDRLGFLFQLTDDILDACGSEGEMGKPVEKDSVLGKANLVTVTGLSAARAEAALVASQVAEGFSALPGAWGDVVMLARYLPSRRS